MTRLRTILEYIKSQRNWIVPFVDLKAHFNGDLTGLRVALERGLLTLQGDCYLLTNPGHDFLKRATLEVPTTKVCYQCQRNLPAEDFWKDNANGDGLFKCCITCSSRKKRQAMELRRKTAEFAIREAAPKLVEAARLWDQAVIQLANAWREIVAADAIVRQNMHELETENESGRMHARLTYPRASFVLNIALSAANYPQSMPLLRELNFPDSLAEYIGNDPHLDYVTEPLEPAVQRKKRVAHGKAA